MAISTRFLLLLSFLCCLSQMACAVIMETVRVDPYDHEGVHPMYQNGSHSVCRLQRVKANKKRGLCCPLLVAIPDDPGSYPVVQFQHGFLLSNGDYHGLITQVATWGFIVVAPQMPVTVPAKPEITKARSILNWMSNPETGLIASLPQKYAAYQPDFDKVALAGHSRGGLVVFGLALNVGNQLQNYSAIVGLGPVDAIWPVTPSILTHNESTLNVGVPTLIVGTGRGSEGLCAPKGWNHFNFYTNLTPPSFHFVATYNGHNDFTEDCSWGDKLSKWRCTLLCKDGPSRQLNAPICSRHYCGVPAGCFLS